MVIFTTLWKSTLKMALFRRCLTLFKSTLFNSALFNVVNFNVDVHNVISTLIWRCVTSRCHINPKTTLKRRWNVCWVMIHPEVPIGCPKKGFEFSEANRLFFIRIKTKIDEAQYSYYFKVLSLKMFLFRSYFVRNLLMLLRLCLLLRSWKLYNPIGHAIASQKIDFTAFRSFFCK